MSPCYPLAFVRRRLLLAVLLLIAFHSLSVVTLAQSSTATLSGTVTDPNNAVVPGAHVTATNTGTGLKREATTNGSGTFVIPLLPPSTYTVLVESQGFTPAEIRDVVLNVNDNVTLNIELKVGTVGGTVDVKSDAALIKESAEVSTVVDRQFVANLPLNGRSFQSLITLTPGVVQTKSSFNEQGQFSVNGQRADANYFTVDGVSANIGVSSGVPLRQSGGGALPGLSAMGGTNNLVSVDALQEFKMQTSTYAPEFGRTPGAQVQILTRSGTNKFSGTLFEYFRNDALDANDWFANANRLSKPALRQNDFGGVLGGPIIKNRSFFFFSYEGLRLRQPTTSLTSVPSLASRQTAPARQQPFLNAFPIPNGRDLGGGFAEFNASFSNPSTLNAASIRVDHTLSQKLALFGRFNYAPSETVQRGATGASLNTRDLTRFVTQTLTMGGTASFTPEISNELRFNYSRNRGVDQFELDNFGGAVPPIDSILFPVFATRQDALILYGILSPSLIVFQTGLNVENLQRQINLVDNLSFITGSHQLKFGVDYRRLSPVNGPAPYRLFALFTDLGITPPGTPPPIGSVFSGASLLTQIQSRDIVGIVINNFSAYAQDTWRASRRLTFTYGLRWEVNPPPSGTGGKDLFTVRGLENPATIALAPPGTPLYQTTYTNFAPRIGLAYQLSQKQGRETVLRGGFGTFYDLGYGAVGDSASSFPYFRTSFLFGIPFPLDPTLAAPIPFSTSPPVSQITVLDPNLKLPRTYQWNIAVQQSLGINQTLSASYVAAVGRDLLRQDLTSSPNPNFATLFAIRNKATSDYHAMQLQFLRRLSRGLQALASYTWSHSIDIISNGSGANIPPGIVDPRKDRGSSDFDVRHAFNTALTYDIPNPVLGSVASAILRSWSVDTIVNARSATPVDVVTSKFFTGVGFISVRPDLIPNVPLYLDDPAVAGGRRINPAAFSANFSDRQGTLERNALRGFPFWQVNLSLRRQFSLTEKLNLQFRVEFFNIFNHPNFADPNNNFPSLTFGKSTQMLGRSLGSGGTSGGLSPLYQIGGPRSSQFALKLRF
jgi:hypothetical protein